MTIVNDLKQVHESLVAERDRLTRGDEAGRDFALAITAVEDAIMRTNCGFARKHGHFAVADVQALNEA